MTNSYYDNFKIETCKTCLCRNTFGGDTIKIPAHTKVAIACYLNEFHEVSNHYFYVCNDEKVYGKKKEYKYFQPNKQIN